MKSSVQISLGLLLVLVASQIGFSAGDRVRLIRRITASDLPTTLNQTSTTAADFVNPKVVNNTKYLVRNVSTNLHNSPEDNDHNAVNPSLLNTDVLKTSATTNRQQRPKTDEPNLTTTTPPLNSSTSPTTRKYFIRTNRTNIIRPKKPKNCTIGLEGICDQKPATNEIKTVLELSNITDTNDVKIVDSKKKTSKDKLQESSTDRTFNNIVSSSTARIVIQENIHTDILRHLTTASYAHYETDYVLDDDPYEAESHVSSSKASTNQYEEYAKQGEHSNYNVTFTTPSSKLFDENYARVSEGIRQNLDDIEERSEEYEHFSSSSDNEESVLSEGLPKNDSKVSLQFLNHVNVISNDSSSANSRHGDLFIDNGTHVQLERSFIQTKIDPEVSSTVKYVIDDEYSTTRRITTDNDKEENSIKESVGSASSQVDQEGAEDSGVVPKIQKKDSLAGEYEDTGSKDVINKSIIKADEILTSKNKTRPEQEYGQSGPTSSRTVFSTTIRTNTYGRGRMYSSEKYPSYNTNNTVEEGVTEKEDNKRTRSKASQQSDITMEPTINTRSKLYSSRTSSTSSQRPVLSSEETPVTSPRAYNIRTRRPIVSTGSTSRSEINAQNNEGNYILANDNYRLPNRRGTVKYGNLRNAEQSEQFPIPPTASAWSLVTMKEPGRRTRLSSTQTTTPTPLNDLSDSEASGSFSSDTTIYNTLAPSSFLNSTRPSKYVYGSSAHNKVPISTESSVHPNDDKIVTTQYPDMDITTTESGVSESEDSFSTQQPYMTTITSSREYGKDVEDVEDERFDVNERTTLGPIADAELEVTTSSGGNYPTTTGVYETTQIPKEYGHKSVDEEREEDDVENVNTTPEPVVAELDTGLTEERDGLVGNVQGDVILESNQENKDAESVSKINLDKDLSQEKQQGAKDIHIGPKVHEEVSHTEEVNGRSHVEGHNQDDVHSVIEEEPDYGGPSGQETETEASNAIGGGVSKTDSTNKTQAIEDQDETSTLSTTESSTSAADDDFTTIQEISDIHTFIRLFVEAPMHEFCNLTSTFKEAVASRLTGGTGRTVNQNQVILRNIGSEQCSNVDTANTTNEGELIPVEMHIVDEIGNYDQQLTDAFTLLWGTCDLDFSLRIRKVDAIDESLAYAGNNGNGAVIAAIAISCIAAVCLLILAVLLVVMRKRQKKVNYGMRCTPVSLDAYSLDSVSVHGSVRRKGGVRASKRSYGNPAFDDPGSPTNSMNFASLATFVTNREAIEEEFSNIPHVTPKSDELPEGAETKNRYANVIPLPETRVVLTVVGEEPLSDYINANYVSGAKNAPKYYIACQAPLQTTVNDFWRMIWEKQSKVIIMLTDLAENGVEKCADYLPPSEVLDCHRLFGDYQVTLKKREVRETYIISTLQLKNMESNSWREVVHLWYLEWPSQGVPAEPSSVIAFLIEARSYMKNAGSSNVVHCSPGTGRTGTVLACDLCIRDFEQTRLVDVPRCVARLRKDRAGCVQTRDQYAFIYQVLNLYATKLTGGGLDESI